MNDEVKRLVYALGLMYNQYCAKDGHLFMSAGEEAQEVLQRYGLATDEIGRGEFDADKFEL